MLSICVPAQFGLSYTLTWQCSVTSVCGLQAFCKSFSEIDLADLALILPNSLEHRCSTLNERAVDDWLLTVNAPAFASTETESNPIPSNDEINDLVLMISILHISV